MNASDANDPVLARLADADPARLAPLPTAESATARRTLDGALDGTALEGTAVDETALHETTGSPDRPFGAPPAAPERVSNGRRGRYLVGAGAAMAVLAGGLVVAAPGAEPALAVVQGAATTTASVDEGVMTTRVSLDAADGAESHDLTAEIVTRFDQGDLAITGDILSSSDGAEDLVDGPEGEAVLVDGIVYAQVHAEGAPEGWYGVEAPDLLTSTLSDVADPRSILSIVQEFTDATEDGTGDLDGTELTRYTATVDLSDETLRTTGPLSAMGQLDVSPTGTVDVVLLVDGDVLRSMTLVGTAGEASSPDAAVDFEIEVVFTQFGEDQGIVAPEGAEIVDLGAELGGFGEGD